MSHAVLADPSLHAALLEIDADLAAANLAEPCGHCGGKLHVSNYMRVPLGTLAALGRGFRIRHSACCSRDGCRRRRTAPSVRFLGRRRWIGAIVVLASALQHGLSRRRLAVLEDELGVDERTLRRWRRWWFERFARCSFWREARIAFATPSEPATLPLSLLDQFFGELRERLVHCLRFLEPVSVGAARHGLAS